MKRIAMITLIFWTSHILSKKRTMLAITNNEAENNENNHIDVEEVEIYDVLQVNKLYLLQPQINIESDLPSEVDALNNIEESQKKRIHLYIMNLQT